MWEDLEWLFQSFLHFLFWCVLLFLGYTAYLWFA